MTKPGERAKHREITNEREAKEVRYAPAQRLHALRAFLNSPGGASVYDIAERFDVSARTAIRYVEALRRAGEPLFDEVVGKRAPTRSDRCRVRTPAGSVTRFTHRRLPFEDFTRSSRSTVARARRAGRRQPVGPASR
jgi:predicted DNA-binding transcriptional regulator YafY